MFLLKSASQEINNTSINNILYLNKLLQVLFSLVRSDKWHKAKYEFLTKYETNVDENIKEQSLSVDEHLENTLKYAVPKKDFNKALGLWNYLNDRKGPLLNWNENGEITVKGTSVRGSHLIDLLKHAVKGLMTQKIKFSILFDLVIK